jgi:hypothetical protein
MNNESASKILMWLLGVIGSLLIAAILGGLKFYTEWSADEATEDQEKATLMFDSANQKVKVIEHPDKVPSAWEQRLKIERDADFQKFVIKEIKEIKEMTQRTGVQAYQANRKTDTLNRNVQHALEHVD